MEPAAQVEGGVPGMGVLIYDRPRRARADAARKRREEIPGFAWLTAKNKPKSFFALTREKQKQKNKSTKTPPKNTKKHQKKTPQKNTKKHQKTPKNTKKIKGHSKNERKPHGR